MISFLLSYQFINYINAPISGQVGFQTPTTLYMLSVLEFHALVMFYCSVVFICVASFLFEIWYLFRESVYPQATRRNINDNYKLEHWFMRIPLIIVGLLIVPSWALLYASNEPNDCNCTVNIVGSQWQWNYEVHNYPLWASAGYDWSVFWKCVSEGLKWNTSAETLLTLNNIDKAAANYKYGFLWYTSRNNVSNIIFAGFLQTSNALGNSQGFLTWESYNANSLTLPVNELETGHYSLLEVSSAVLLPVRQWVRLNITATDVIHSWAVPSFGINIDAVPGRLNTGYVLILHEGLFYGQCSEFCGNDHYSMSIVVNGTDALLSYAG